MILDRDQPTALDTFKSCCTHLLDPFSDGTLIRDSILVFLIGLVRKIPDGNWKYIAVNLFPSPRLRHVSISVCIYNLDLLRYLFD